jgi:hypothetical protein
MAARPECRTRPSCASITSRFAAIAPRSRQAPRYRAGCLFLLSRAKRVFSASRRAHDPTTTLIGVIHEHLMARSNREPVAGDKCLRVHPVRFGASQRAIAPGDPFLADQLHFNERHLSALRRVGAELFEKWRGLSRRKYDWRRRAIAARCRTGRERNSEHRCDYGAFELSVCHETKQGSGRLGRGRLVFAETAGDAGR